MQFFNRFVVVILFLNVLSACSNELLFRLKSESCKLKEADDLYFHFWIETLHVCTMKLFMVWHEAVRRFSQDQAQMWPRCGPSVGSTCWPGRSAPPASRPPHLSSSATFLSRLSLSTSASLSAAVSLSTSAWDFPESSLFRATSCSSSLSRSLMSGHFLLGSVSAFWTLF